MRAADRAVARKVHAARTRAAFARQQEGVWRVDLAKVEAELAAGEATPDRVAWLRERRANLRRSLRMGAS